MNEAAKLTAGAPQYEVIIIGAGVGGIYQLYRLAQLGVNVTRRRGRRRPRWHLVPQPLSGLPVRFGELHVRLLVLERAAERMALERALLRAAGEPALSQLRRRQVRSAQIHAVQLRRQRRDVRRRERPLASAAAERPRVDVPLPRHRRGLTVGTDAAAHSRHGDASKVRRSIRTTGRRSRSNSRANASPWSVPARPGFR